MMTGLTHALSQTDGAPHAPARALRPAPRPHDHPKARILLVDDEPAVLSALSRDLAGRFDVATASCPFAGLERIQREEAFAVIVADMRMPGLDGADFLESAMVHAPRSVRLMLSGDTRPHSLVAAINRAGVFRFLEKPCQRDELIAALDAAVSEYERLCQPSAHSADIFAGLNHELRTPLNHIIGFASMIENGHVSDVEPGGDTQTYAQLIRESGDCLLGLVDALVTLAALRDGSQTLHRQPTSMQDLLDALRRANQHKAAGRSVLLTVEADPGAPPTVFIAPHLISFAVNIFLDRLMGAVPSETRIDLRFERNQDGDDWMLTIRCAALVPDRLAAPDTPGGEPALTPAAIGGLGFAMAQLRAVAHLHHGAVEVSSRRDDGTNTPSTCIALRMDWTMALPRT